MALERRVITSVSVRRMVVPEAAVHRYGGGLQLARVLDINRVRPARDTARRDIMNDRGLAVGPELAVLLVDECRDFHTQPALPSLGGECREQLGASVVGAVAGIGVEDGKVDVAAAC